MQKLTPFSCRGTLYKNATTNACYDIQLGDLDFLDFFEHVCPDSDTFDKVFGESFDNLNIQGECPRFERMHVTHRSAISHREIYSFNGGHMLDLWKSMGFYPSFYTFPMILTYHISELIDGDG